MAEKVVLLQEKMSWLEVAVQEKKAVTIQPGEVSRGDIEELHSLKQQLATQGQQLATQEQKLATQERQLATQKRQLAMQRQDLVAKHQENRELVSQMEHLTRRQGSLQSQNQQLTSQVQEQAKQLSALTEQNGAQQQQQEGLVTLTQLETQHEELTEIFQQQLTDQLAEQRRMIQEEIQQQFQAILQQVQSLQPSWSIAQHHLQVTTQVLGRGAWGEVRVGTYQGTRVAVKKIHDVIISNHNRKLFEREMFVASRVRHPHLVLFIGAVTTGNLTIVSELMETSLRKLLEENKLKASNLLPISKDVACALAYLHSLPDPIVHRDVSSANVLLNAKQDGWCAKLGDFGSANFLAKLGTVGPGCIAYSAPEAGNPSQQGTKMDVYSFGVLLFEMCVGELVGQHNLLSTRAAVANWTNWEKKFLGVFALRCTETNPDKRPNMVDFVKQI